MMDAGRSSGNRKPRLAIVLSHPTQYFSPWFRHIAAQGDIEIKLFYLWDFGVEVRHDKSFGQTLKWDIPLLDGYEFEFVPNKSADPGTHHFSGLDNPSLVDRIAEWQPDAILMFGYAYRSHLRVLFSTRLRKIPLLMRGDSHDLSRPSGMKSALKRWLRKILFKRYAGLLAVGKANAEYFRHCDVPDTRIMFVPHCVDNERFQAAESQANLDAGAWRQELGIGEQTIVFLFVGKFENKKRPQDLVRAFIALRSETSAQDCALVMTGSGELEPELRSIVGEQSGRSIFFVPFQNQTRMPKVYALGDVLVLPSIDETWGLAINEAMNLARPAIVSSHVGCGPDLIEGCGTGWIFEAGKPDALLKAMREALSSGKKGLALKGLAAQKWIEQYSYEAATRGLIQALNGILGR